jgi:hypothetical protein
VVRFQYVLTSFILAGSADDRPVYAGDIARAVEICCRDDRQVIDAVGGRVIEAGGPEGMSSTDLYALFYPIHISRDHGTCLEILWDKEVHPQSTLFRGYDPRLLSGETSRESIHRYSGSGKYIFLQCSMYIYDTLLMTRSVNYDTTT